jgi:microbial collagenase
MRIRRLSFLVVLLQACTQPTAPSPDGDRIEPPAILIADGPLVPMRVLRDLRSAPHGSPEVQPDDLAAPTPPELRETQNIGASREYLGESCTSVDLVGLSPAQLVTYLHDAPYDCLYYLWSYDANVAATMTDAKVVAVANAAQSAAAGYDGTNAGSERQYLFFLRIAYYHAFYQSYSLAPATLTQVQLAYSAFAASPGFNVNTSEAGAILNEWINGVDASGSAHLYVAGYTQILNDFPGREGNWNQRVNVYSIALAIRRNSSNAAFEAALTPALVSAMGVITLDFALDNPDGLYVINTMIFALGGVLQNIPAFHTQSVQALTDVIDAYAPLTQPYLWAVRMLTLYNACQTADPMIVICLDDLIDDVLDSVVPNTFSYEDATMNVRTAETEATVRALYHASRQVQAQFSRVTEHLLPVANDPVGILQIILYASRADYEAYQPVLFGLSASNGGIYIEQDETFYTYQRTGETYSFEELFRHEFVHYLIGRYLVSGLWGAEPIYQNNRFVWFDEGFAEFLAYGTPTGIPVRWRLVSLVEQDGVNRMHVSEILEATYSSGFAFYRYSGLFFQYLYQYERNDLLALLAAARAGDTVGFDAIVASMSSDAALDAAYPIVPRRAGRDRRHVDRSVDLFAARSRRHRVLDLFDPNRVQRGDRRLAGVRDRGARERRALRVPGCVGGERGLDARQRRR